MVSKNWYNSTQKLPTQKLLWLLSGVLVCLCIRTNFPLPYVCVLVSQKKKKELVQFKFNNSNFALSENQKLKNKFTKIKERNLTRFEEGDTKVKKPRDQGGGTSNQWLKRWAMMNVTIFFGRFQSVDSVCVDFLHILQISS